MTGDRWVSLIALSAWLVLAGAAWRARKVSARRTLQMAALWAAIFLVATLLFRTLGR